MGYTLAAGLDLRRDGDLHLGLAIRAAAGHPRRLTQLFSVIFASNAIGDHGRQPGQPRARGPLRAARGCSTPGVLCVGAAGGLGVLVSRRGRPGASPGLLPSFFVMVSSVGIVLPERGRARPGRPPAHRRQRIGAARRRRSSPPARWPPRWPGVGGSHTALPMAIVMATLPLAGLACLRFAGRPSGRAPRAARCEEGRVGTGRDRGGGAAQRARNGRRCPAMRASRPGGQRGNQHAQLAVARQQRALGLHVAGQAALPPSGSVLASGRGWRR